MAAALGRERSVRLASFASTGNRRRNDPSDFRDGYLIPAGALRTIHGGVSQFQELIRFWIMRRVASRDTTRPPSATVPHE